MKVTRKIVQIDQDKCNGCGQCILSCAEGAIVIRNGKAEVIADMYCDGLGACMGSCPTDALSIIEREADPFDESAVEELLASQSHVQQNSPSQGNHLQSFHPQGCPGSQAVSFGACPSSQASPFTGAANNTQKTPISGTCPTGFTPHWPVKLRLTTPHAPYLQKAHLYLAADCSAFAAMNFHGLLTKTPTALLTLCPKFETKESIMEKLNAIFATGQIQSCTTIRMEVPCCAGLHHHVVEALNNLGEKQHSIPHTAIILSRDGQLVLA